MAKSKRQAPRYQIVAGSPYPAGDGNANGTAGQGEALSISLKHYDDGHQCFGEWDAKELRRFSSTIRHLRKLTRKDLNATNIISKLKNQRGWVLERPAQVDKELPIFELRIAKSSNLRAFGVMPESVFYLIWLDRSHRVL